MVTNALDHYVRKCESLPVDARPLMMALHFDVFGELRGDISTDVVEDGHAFALLAPFVMAAEVADSFLVADVSTLERRRLLAVRLSVRSSGTSISTWSAKAWMSDRGRFGFGVPKRDLLSPGPVADAVRTALASRACAQFLTENFTYEQSVRAAIEVLERL